MVNQSAPIAHDGQESSELLQIVPFQSSLRAHFYRLNAQWLEKHFHIEEIDRRMLGDPETYVLQPGGAIFFAQRGDQIIGTCALLHESTGTYELSKMSVDESFRGLGAGRRLLNAAIDEYHRRDGQVLFLESSSILTTALRMYEQAGFEMQSAVRAGSHYQRADVYMVYRPARSDSSARR